MLQDDQSVSHLYDHVYFFFSVKLSVVQSRSNGTQCFNHIVVPLA